MGKAVARPWRVQYLRDGVWRTVVGNYYESEASANKAITDGWIVEWIGADRTYRAQHIDAIRAAR